MATGTGNLPNDGMSFTPFDPLPASQLNDIVENIEAVADGSGIGDGAIDTTQLADGAVTPDKLSLSADYAETSTGGTTTSTSFTTTLSGGGANPTVTIDIGAGGLALVTVGAIVSNSGATRCSVSFVATGANTIAASTMNSYTAQSFTAATRYGGSKAVLLTGLNPGATTFELAYSVSANTGTFENRNISAVAL